MGLDWMAAGVTGGMCEMGRVQRREWDGDGAMCVVDVAMCHMLRVLCMGGCACAVCEDGRAIWDRGALGTWMRGVCAGGCVRDEGWMCCATARGMGWSGM